MFTTLIRMYRQYHINRRPDKLKQEATALREAKLQAQLERIKESKRLYCSELTDTHRAEAKRIRNEHEHALYLSNREL